MATHPLHTDGRREYLVAYSLMTASGPLAFASLVLFSMAVSDPSLSDVLSAGFLAAFAAAAGALVLGRYLRRRAWQWVAGSVHLADPAWMRRLALAVDTVGILVLPIVLRGTGADVGVRLLFGTMLYIGCGFVASRPLTRLVPWLTRFFTMAIAGAILISSAEMPLTQTIWLSFAMVLTGALFALIFRVLRGRPAPFLG